VICPIPAPKKRRRIAVFGLALAFAALPNQIGFQDLGALIARQPAVSSRWRVYVFGSPSGTMQAAKLDMPRPIGTTIPKPPLYVLASVDPNEITGALGRQLLGDDRAPLQFPSVNRANKGDALVARRRRPMPPRALTPAELVPAFETEAPFTDIVATLEHGDAVPRFDRYDDYELPPSVDAASKTPDIDLPYVDLPPVDYTKLPLPDSAEGEARLYFGIDPLAAPRAKISPWLPGQAPHVLAPPADPDIKLSALMAPRSGDAASKAGESIAGKGEVTGVGKRPMSPAERMSLAGASRAKAEKCLANAVYFEARDEPVRAQIAVAQVVLNRAFSPFYPNNVCDVVYQNARCHLACQFTFACDGKPDVVTEPESWIRAKRIASDMLDGKLWMPEVAKSTHYHDDWAHPNWVREMRRIDKQGGLIFYRPRNWGDGAEEPKWGDAQTTAKAAAKL
jgi:spore germination cell wall hydrolase CwlJ-like protein